MVVPSGDGVHRVRMLVESEADGARAALALREAMLTPVEESGPEVVLARKKLAALANRPLLDRALLDSVRCTGEPFGVREASAVLGARELEGFRRAAHGIGRVAFATAGSDRLGEAVATALARADAWPSADAPADDCGSTAADDAACTTRPAT